MAVGDATQGVHLGRLAVEVYGNDGRRAGGDRRLDGCRVERGGVRVDVRENGVAPAAEMASAVNAAVRGVVITSSPGPMPAAMSASWIASVPLPHADRMAGFADAGEFFLECGQLFAEHKPAPAPRRGGWRGRTPAGDARRYAAGHRTERVRSPIVFSVFAVVVHRALQPLAQVNGGTPAEKALDLAPVGVEVADVDPFAFGREGDLAEPPTAADFDQHRPKNPAG